MRNKKITPLAIWSVIAAFATLSSPAAGGEPKPPAPASQEHDGQHDFDFELGRWKIQLKKLARPLHGSNEWITFEGTSQTRPLWNGKAQVEELEVDGATGHIEGMTVRLYSPASRQWSLYWASPKNGRFETPTVGAFKDGRGEFFDEETYEGRPIRVRYVWSEITKTSAHFEQSFSVDGGKTWETNWITQQTRVE